MKKILFTFSIIAALAAKSQSPVFNWVKTASGSFESNGDMIIEGATTLIATGSFSGTADFDPAQPGTLTLTSAGENDIFISKRDSSGTVLWVKRIGGSGYDYPTSVKNDAAGNIYLTGVFRTTVDFDPGPGVFNLTSTGINLFICKLDANGNFLWAKKTNGLVAPTGMTLDASGAIYICGSYMITANTPDFDPGTGVFNFPAMPANQYDMFILKLDAAGNFVWAKGFMGPQNDYAFCIGLDGSGNILAAGHFSGTVDFDPGAGTTTLSALGGAIFVVKLDPAGNLSWVKQVGDAGRDVAGALAIDKSDDVILTGLFNNSPDFDPGAGTFSLTAAGPPGESDAFVLKLSNSGNFIWARSIGGNQQSYGTSIAVDKAGDIYTAGTFSGTADLDPGTATLNFVSAGGGDAYISKLSSSGNFISAWQIGGTGNDEIMAIVPDNIGRLYADGTFENTCDFNPGPATNSETSQGAPDYFMLKLGPGLPPPNLAGIFTTSENARHSVYPNPSEGKFSIVTQSDAMVNIYSPLGQLILSKQAGNQPLEIDLSGQAKGIYLVEVIQNGESLRKKIIVE